MNAAFSTKKVQQISLFINFCCPPKIMTTQNNMNMDLDMCDMCGEYKIEATEFRQDESGNTTTTIEVTEGGIGHAYLHVPVYISNFTEYDLDWIKAADINNLFDVEAVLDEIPSDSDDDSDDSSREHRRSARLDELTRIRRLQVPFPSKLWTYVYLQKLTIIRCPHRTIPMSISNLPLLQELCINDCDFEELPHTICHLRKLEKLEIYLGRKSENAESLLLNICLLLHDLKELHLCQTNIESIPDEICNLENLERLELGGVDNLRLVVPFNVLASMNSLKYLNLTCIRDIDFCYSGVGAGSALQQQHVYHHLEELHLAYIQELTSLPNHFGAICPNLKKFKIDNCKQLLRLPPSLFDAPDLHTLELESCDFLESIPSEIEKAKKLNRLLIIDCPLETLPESIGNLKNLEALSILRTEIESLPNEIGNLISLTSLEIEDVGYYTHSPSLEAIPSSLSNLASLKKLKIENCTLECTNTLPLIPELKSLEIKFNRGSSNEEETPSSQPVLTIFDDNAWKEESSLEELSIGFPLYYHNDDCGERILSRLPRTLQKLHLSQCMITDYNDVLPNLDLPRGIMRLKFFKCFPQYFSEHHEAIERICRCQLLEKYERLCFVRTGWHDSLELHEIYLLARNRCGRFLLKNSNGADDASIDGLGYRTSKPIPLSMWPTVLARVKSVLNLREFPATPQEELNQIEAAVLYELLHGPALLCRST